MFKCDQCGKTTKSGEKQERVPMKHRPKKYYNPNSKRNKHTVGHEIVKEIVLCEKCYKEYSNETQL